MLLCRNCGHVSWCHVSKKGPGRRWPKCRNCFKSCGFEIQPDIFSICDDAERKKASVKDGRSDAKN